jgi:hypothetical protein
MSELQLDPTNTVCRALKPAYRVLFFLLLTLVFLPVCPLPAQTDSIPAYRDRLIETARAHRLSAERYWNIILHYRPSRKGMTSLVDDPKFFLSPIGKTDPGAELEATINSFFNDPGQRDDHPRCRFPGRYAWLRQELSIDEKQLPEVSCKKLDDAFTIIDPQSVVLIFPATHNNSPTSMFGHTLIRINNKAKNDLLAFAVNYAAAPNDSLGFLYAFKGVFGFYPGYYSILPYYEKVKEYNALEHRDIWEYRLNLTPEETRRMVLHIWDMQGIYSDYYFFDENCSYDLLFLIEAARPTVHLTDTVGQGTQFWVIPSDTIREIRQNNLIDGVQYRPSQAMKINAISKHLTGNERELARELGLGTREPGDIMDAVPTSDDRMRVLDLAAEYIQYLASKHEITEEVYKKRFLTILQARSRLGQATEELYSTPQTVRPDDGHLPPKVSLGGGCRTGSCYGEVGWRAAYHDLLDNDDGFVHGSQIDFFQIRGRYYGNNIDEARLESFRLIDIVSLSPWSRFFKPVSWKVATGVEQRTFTGDRDRLVAFVNGGAGLTSQIGQTLLFVTVDGELGAGSAYDDGFAVSAGGTAGIMTTLAGWWKVNLSIKDLEPVAGDIYRSMKGEVDQNFTVNTNNSVSLLVSRERTNWVYRSEATVLWNYYY